MIREPITVIVEKKVSLPLVKILVPGLQGIKGDKGDQGIQGEKGEKGDEGEVPILDPDPSTIFEQALGNF